MAEERTILKWEKLTKKYFMDLPENVFLANNAFEKRCISAYAEYVKPLSKRSQQWIKIKKAFVDQRLCNIFRS